MIRQKMREEFVEIWQSAKAFSLKLEFYNLFKHDFNPENYLSSVKLADTLKSLTKLRISYHNLYIKRGRYETPIVPRDSPDKLIKRDFTLPDRSGTGRGSGGGMLRSTLAR